MKACRDSKRNSSWNSSSSVRTRLSPTSFGSERSQIGRQSTTPFAAQNPPENVASAQEPEQAADTEPARSARQSSRRTPVEAVSSPSEESATSDDEEAASDKAPPEEPATEQREDAADASPTANADEPSPDAKQLDGKAMLNRAVISIPPLPSRWSA